MTETTADETDGQATERLIDGDLRAESVTTEAFTIGGVSGEYAIVVGRTTVEEQQTGEQVTMWKAKGIPQYADDEETERTPVAELSAYLPEAVMGVCETLKRRRGDPV
jgi:hypothetical protein